MLLNTPLAVLMYKFLVDTFEEASSWLTRLTPPWNWYRIECCVGTTVSKDDIIIEDWDYNCKVQALLKDTQAALLHKYEQSIICILTRLSRFFLGDDMLSPVASFKLDALTLDANAIKDQTCDICIQANPDIHLERKNLTT